MAHNTAARLKHGGWSCTAVTISGFPTDAQPRVRVLLRSISPVSASGNEESLTAIFKFCSKHSLQPCRGQRTCSCPALPPSPAAGVPASRVILTPSSSSSLSDRQLGSHPHRALGCGGLTFTLNLANLTLPLSVAPSDSYASDPIPAYYSLSSVHAWPCCCVKSQVQVPGRDKPCRVTPHHS
ncbi:hypothetical protein CRENBAI_004717 [Crenichthys baileyi]|uniref:Uncharacterized protein n=1 Tax=Crenichthys baileyi TaxID=28760 RepID=A0AAV9R6V3_9TELE